MSDLREAVAEIVDRLDPEGLLAMGAPSDEYDHEIDDLTLLVREGRVTEENVCAIWEGWFGPRSAVLRSRSSLAALTHDLAALGG